MAMERRLHMSMSGAEESKGESRTMGDCMANRMHESSSRLWGSEKREYAKAESRMMQQGADC